MTASHPSTTSPLLLGEPIDVSVDAHPRAADQVISAVLAEIDRLERIFDPDDPASELSQWKESEQEESAVSPELGRVLAASERFWVFSRGAFHPGSAALVRRWQRAEAEGTLPTASEMRQLAAALELPYTAVNGPIRRTGDCSQVDLSSIARGYILDRAMQVGWRLGLASSIRLDAGGDQRHQGSGGVLVPLLNLFAEPGDSEPIEVVHLRDAALTRSSRLRGGFQVGDRRLRDIIDPRTGWPNDDIVAVATLAPEAMTADALATVIGVGWGSSVAQVPSCEWLVVHADGRVVKSEGWPRVGGCSSAS